MNCPPVLSRGLGGESRTAEMIAAHVVDAAIWAPSVNNTQPWWFSVGRSGIGVHADGDRQLMVADPGGREMLISCGAAVFTARLAVRAFGYVPVTEVLPDPAEPSLVARVSWRREVAATEFEQRLYGQVRQRRTHRGGFDPVPLAPELLALLRRGAERYGATLRVAADEPSRAALAAAVQTAEQALRLDSAHVRELAAWAPPPGSARPDGVPPTAYPAHDGRSFPYFPGRDFAHGHGWGQPRLSFVTAPSAGVVCVLTTRADRQADWVNAGQALQWVLLTSAAWGVAAALHSQPLELDWMRENVRALLSDGAYPQLLIRLGTVIQTAVSVRRPPASVLS